ncbi:MAG: orotate phosphoribosyltransferase [Actinomycetota bacterium]|nr:orotate phosphoribosyltransferase [Actinomycetota bacterium]
MRACGAGTAIGGPQLSLREQVCSIVREHGHLRLDEPVQLASGDFSRDFVDAKRALQQGADLEIACRAMLELVGDVDFEAVGGLTLGADQFAHVLSVLARKRWFVVRKAVKGRGTNKRVEGAEIGGGVKVLLVDDVVTTGSSILEAYEVARQLGADVRGAVTLLDRGEAAGPKFDAVGVPYFPVLTYRDLGIEPVGGVLTT